jgi:serine/threonine protein kinase
LFGSQHYGPSIDLWAAGAVVAELSLLKPLFPGVTDIDQIVQVARIRGTPTPDTWPVRAAFTYLHGTCVTIMQGITKLPDYGKIILLPQAGTPLGTILRANYCGIGYVGMINAGTLFHDRQFADLLTGLLCYDPQRRLTAAQVCLSNVLRTAARVYNQLLQALNHVWFRTAPLVAERKDLVSFLDRLHL